MEDIHHYSPPLRGIIVNYFLYFSFITFYLCCLLWGNFIIIYVINRTLHGCLGIEILSSRAESISHSFAALTREKYFQHSKINFVCPRRHVISSISSNTQYGLSQNQKMLSIIDNSAMSQLVAFPIRGQSILDLVIQRGFHLAKRVL